MLVGLLFGLTGLGIGTWDVGMNVEAADVERRLDRTLMPRFHAGFSVGTVAGALLGAAAAATDVAVEVLPGVGHFVPEEAPEVVAQRVRALFG